MVVDNCVKRLWIAGDDSGSAVEPTLEGNGTVDFNVDLDCDCISEREAGG